MWSKLTLIFWTLPDGAKCLLKTLSITICSHFCLSDGKLFNNPWHKILKLWYEMQQVISSVNAKTFKKLFIHYCVSHLQVTMRCCNLFSSYKALLYVSCILPRKLVTIQFNLLQKSTKFYVFSLTVQMFVKQVLCLLLLYADDLFVLSSAVCLH